MAIEYLGLSSVNGPLVVLEGLQDAFYDEIVEFTVEGNIRKMGRIIELNEDKAVIQVFEGTQDMSLQNTHTRLTGAPWRWKCLRICWGEPLTGSAFRWTDWGRLAPETAET